MTEALWWAELIIVVTGIVLLGIILQQRRRTHRILKALTGNDDACRRLTTADIVLLLHTIRVWVRGQQRSDEPLGLSVRQLTDLRKCLGDAMYTLSLADVQRAMRGRDQS